MNKTEKIALREAIIVVLMGAIINFPLQTPEVPTSPIFWQLFASVLLTLKIVNKKKLLIEYLQIKENIFFLLFKFININIL